LCGGFEGVGLLGMSGRKRIRVLVLIEFVVGFGWFVEGWIL
jgi:hypothetical protein